MNQHESKMWAKTSQYSKNEYGIRTDEFRAASDKLGVTVRTEIRALHDKGYSLDEILVFIVEESHITVTGLRIQDRHKMLQQHI